MHELTIDDLDVPDADRVRALMSACRFIDTYAGDRMTAFDLAAEEVTAHLAMMAASKVGKPRRVSSKTMQRAYYAWKRTGGNWQELADRRKLAIIRAGILTTKPAFLAHLAALAAKHKRNLKSAVLDLHREWRAGEIIPGYEGRNYKRNLPLPAGWSYENLLHRFPDERTLTMTRQGMRAAAPMLPMVATTRAGCWPCSHVMFDDVWLDCLAWGPAPNGKTQLGRPLQIGALDYYTGKRLSYGTKLRTMDESGKHLQLTEDEMLMVLCGYLYNVGYSPRGTVLIVEHGTAAISEAVEQRLYDITEGRCRVERSGIVGKQQVGAWEGRGFGNFRFKASLESWHNLLHNRMDDEPLHVGHGRKEPEALHGIRKAQEKLLAEYDKLPDEVAAQLVLCAPSLTELAERLIQVVGGIDNRTDHDLEGWEECGFVTQEATLDGQSWTSLDRIPAPLAAALVQSAATNPGVFRQRRMSPQEAWLREIEKPENKLIRLSCAECVALMGLERAFPVTHHGGTFTITAKKRHYAHLQFSTEIITPAGYKKELPYGPEYRAVFNPLTMNLFVLDEKDRVLGEAPQITRASRADQAALEQAMGESARRTAAITARAAAPLMPQTMADEEQRDHNAAVLAAYRNPALGTPAPKLGNRRAAPALPPCEAPAEDAPTTRRATPALTLAEDDELPSSYAPGTFC